MVDLSTLISIVRDQQRLKGRWDQFPPYLQHYTSMLRKKRPKKTSSLIALPYSQPQSHPDWSKIIAISKYRTPFSVIEELASLLAPTVVEFGIVPTIVPLAERRFMDMNWNTPIVKALTNNGILLFDWKSSDE